MKNLFIFSVIFLTLLSSFSECKDSLEEDQPFPHGLNSNRNPFSKKSGIRQERAKNRSRIDRYNQENNWGFREDVESTTKQPIVRMTTTVNPDTLPVDPRHNGLLKDIGSVGVGGGVGVGVPGNDPVSVGWGVSVGLDGSGPAGGLPPFAQTIFPRQGEAQSLNDYDGNKDTIQSSKYLNYINAIRLGYIKLPQYAPPKSTVNVNTGIGVLGGQAPSGG
ncbi:unnamed protein product [Caenorhabditis angaria]|uniref:Uncharacterized protein n=1 Tax=Caenorhabditis angaria TaxID=860376 RepID=A0A9P1IE74_9PELO|nr:unnamed protein product [Caenorhabditis angaria]